MQFPDAFLTSPQFLRRAFLFRIKSISVKKCTPPSQGMNMTGVQNAANRKASAIPAVCVCVEGGTPDKKVATPFLDNRDPL